MKAMTRRITSQVRVEYDKKVDEAATPMSIQQIW
jgi:hypothetical protein